MRSANRLPAHLADRVKSCPVDSERVKNLLDRSEKDLKTAQTIRPTDAEVAYTIVYDSMLHSGLALMAACGVRPDVIGKHKTVIDYAGHQIGAQYREAIEAYDRMRRKRHRFIYEPSPYECTDKELDEALASAKRFLKSVRAFIKENI